MIKLKKIASDSLEKEVKDILISVPSYFNYFQRELIKNAGNLIGLNILRVISAPSATSIDYAFKYYSTQEKQVIIIDIGGGFFNIGLASFEDKLSEIRAIDGIPIGGEDFNKKILEYCAEEYEQKTSINILLNPRLLAKLRLQCEKAKIQLSKENETSIEIFDIFTGEKINIVITREKFEYLCMDFFRKYIQKI